MIKATFSWPLSLICFTVFLFILYRR